MDAQNSVALVTDQNGQSPALNGAAAERDAYDAWGVRRNPNGTDAGFTNIASASLHGYINQYQVNNALL